ncbi:hypothetical protein VP01_7402g1, partial [Puccinia sorghi]
IQQEFNGFKPNWARYSATWSSLSKLAHFRVASLQNLGPNPDFHFARMTCSYTSWIKTISSLGYGAVTMLWNFNYFHRLPKGRKLDHLNPSSPLHPKLHIPSPHLSDTSSDFNHHQLHLYPSAKIIAASVKMIAFKLYNPPPPKTDNNDDPVTQDIQVLTGLKSIKQSISTIETPVESQPTSSPPQKNGGFHTLPFCQCPEGLCQVHALSGLPLTKSQIKKQAQNQHTSADTPTPNAAPTSRAPGDVIKAKNTASQQLKAIQSQHNFQPLTFFLVGGVWGLFFCSKDSRNTPPRAGLCIHPNP